jgi:anti-sigma factor RsiW
MACDRWAARLDLYLDGEVAEEEMRSLGAHIHSCPSCSIDALSRVQMKRAIQAEGKRFTPSAELRRRVEQQIAPKRLRSFDWRWALAAAAAVIIVIGGVTSTYLGSRSAANHTFSEIADLHVSALASSSPVDVVSTDKHTVKPWFQGKIPFSFNLPEVENTGFTLLGGRMVYLEQTPGAQLIYDVRKHHISVFIFSEAALQDSLGDNSVASKRLTFSTDTWTQGGLRYFVIGDASAADIHNLVKLFKTA